MNQRFVKLFSFLVLLSMLATPVGAQTNEPPVDAIAGLRLVEDFGVNAVLNPIEAGTFKNPAAYIVLLEEAAVATYKGGVAGLPATSPEAIGSVKLDTKSPAAVAYADYLMTKQSAILADVARVIGRAPTIRHQYLYAINGMALELDEAEAAAVALVPGVIRVERDTAFEPTTDAGPAWIGANNIWSGAATGALPGTMGEGVIVGILDTGINMDHPSFAEVGGDGYVHTNPFGSGVFVGWCDPGNPNYSPTYGCNDKLIGAWDYADASWGELGGPEDTNGHGSHTASTAAGNVLTSTLFAPTTVLTKTISGVAPHANIIAYDVCGDSCFTTDVVAAIDQSILDGVDVLNESIGIGGDTFSGTKQQAYLGAYAAGIIASRSAGNSGPGAATVGPEPVWTLSSGASTHNRALLNNVTNITSDGTALADIHGLGFTAGYGPAPLVYAGDFGDALCLNPFAPGTFSGEIVICDRGIIARVDKGANVLAGGAGGMILANVSAGESLNGDAHYLPAVHIMSSDAQVLKTWLADPANTNPMAAISGVIYDTNPANGDIMAGFSSRGPAPVDVIKPDVTAPGVDIWAAIHTVDPSDPPEFGFLSGTSMSSPHTAGAAALLRALYPAWSPTQIRSALMTTSLVSGVLKEDGATPANPFDRGAGRIDLSKAAEAGLVLHVAPTAFQNADPSMGGDPKTLNLASMADSNCYMMCSWTRTVYNPTSESMTWQAAYSGAGQAMISPDSFTIAPGATASFDLELNVTALGQGMWHFGELVWSEMSGAAPDVHMPVAIMTTASTDANTLLKEASATEAKVGEVLTYTITLNNTDAVTHTYALTDVVPAGASYVPGSATGGLNYDLASNTLTATVDIPGANIMVVPGSSPAGYQSLTLFGISPLPCSAQCDETIINLTSLAPFSFNGQAYNSIAMVTNGYAIPGGGTVSDITYINQLMPDPTVPNNVLAPWWTDLDLDGTSPTDPGGGIWYAAYLTDGVSTWLVMEWKDAQLYDDPTSVYSFQIWIKNGTDEIHYVYGRVDGSNTVGTVGAEDAFGLVGDSYYYDGSGSIPTITTELVVVTQTSSPAVFTYQVIGTTFDSSLLNIVDVIREDLEAYQAFAFTTIEDNANLQVAHLAPFAMDPGTAVTVTLNGVPALTDFAYGDSTGYIPLPSGSYLVEIFPGGSTTATISGTVNLDAGMNYTAIAVGDGVNQNLGLIALEDDLTAPAAGKFHLRLGHLAPFAAGAATADIRLQDGTLVLGNVDFGDVAAFLELDAGEYDLKITTPGGAVTLIDPLPVTFTEGMIISAFATGDGSNQDLGVFALPAGAPGSFLPLATYLQVAHLAPFAMDPGTAVTVTLNGVPALTDFAYGDSTGYIPLPSGSYLVEIFPGGSATAAISGTVDLMQAMYYTAIAVGDGVNQNLGLIALEDDLTAPAAGKFHLRLGHLAPFAAGAATADIRLQDGTLVLGNVDFGDVAAFLELDAGEYDLKITTPGGAVTLIDPLPVTFTEGMIISAFATGDGSNQDLGVFALPAGVPGFFLPLFEEPEPEVFLVYLPLIPKTYMP